MKKAKHQPSSYEATFHTMTLEPDIPPESVNAWIQDVRDRQKKEELPYLANFMRNSADGKPRIKVNPFKRHTDSDGKFIFEYWPLSRFLDEMREIAVDLKVQDFIYRRADLAIDTKTLYNQTAKFARLFTLSLSDLYGMENRYLSVNPLSHELKTIRADNGGNRFTLQCEHYNRANIDQRAWNRVVCNRFELRSAGEQAGSKHDPRTIAENWLKRLEALPDKLPGIICQQSETLLDSWANFYERLGKETTNAVNAFMVKMERNLYTHEQVRDFLGAVSKSGTNNEKRYRNFMNRWGGVMELYSLEDYRAELDAMTEALRRFLEN